MCLVSPPSCCSHWFSSSCKQDLVLKCIFEGTAHIFLGRHLLTGTL